MTATGRAMPGRRRVTGAGLHRRHATARCLLPASSGHRRQHASHPFPLSPPDPRPTLQRAAGHQHRPTGHGRPTLSASAIPAGMCFSQACQAAQDRAFALAVLLPTAGLGLAIARWATAKPPTEPSQPGGTTFEDPDTGLAFEAGPGEAPELDRQGNLAYRAVSYTPQPVEAGAPGDRVRVAVGPIRARTARTFIFERLIKGTPSRVFGVSLPRPLGVTWAEDESTGRIVVGALTGEAERRAAAAALDPIHLRTTALAPGDVLRAITATTVVFRGAGALAGWSPGTREIVLFGADGAKWPAVRGALRKGDAADGDVTIVVERAEDSSSSSNVGGDGLVDVSDELNPDR